MKPVLFLIVLAEALFQCVLLEGSISIANKSGQGLEKESKYNCDQIITDQVGVIRTPGYPDKYPRYSRCQYTIHRFAKDRCEVKLTIQQFDVAKMVFSNCSADFLEIQSDHKRSRLCGEIRSGVQKFVFFPDNSDTLVFKFQSTFNQKKGFLIDIKQLPYSCKRNRHLERQAAAMRVPPPCNVVINGRTGRITYPMDDSSSTEQCTFKITKSEPQACVVQLDLSSFNVTASAGCEANYLQLPDGQRLCGTLGGSRKILQYPPGTDELVLEYMSTPENNNAFDIQVSQLPGPCDNAESVSNRTGTYDDDTKKNIL